MWRYGFEVEAFFGDEGVVDLPPENYPHDGFPGLVEFRSYGGENITKAWNQVLDQIYRTEIDYTKLMFIPTATFTPEQKRKLKERAFTKEPNKVKNLYGKKPKALGNRTIASLQINISNLYWQGYKNEIRVGNKSETITYPDEFKLFDIPTVIRALDKEFAKEIAVSGRQQGEYCIKDGGSRLEYRSLPNSVFPQDVHNTKIFLERVRKSIEES